MFSVIFLFLNGRMFLEVGGINVEKGSFVRAFVLDVSKSDSLVDLSLKPELINSTNVEQSDILPHISRKVGHFSYTSVCSPILFKLWSDFILVLVQKRQRTSCLDLELHQTVNATVEILKKNYLV